MSGLTKILIVLQLVFSLVCAVLLVLMVSKQEPYKLTADGLKTANVGLSASLADAKRQIAESEARTTEALKSSGMQNSQANQLKTELMTLQNKSDAMALELKAASAALESKNAQLSAALSVANQTVAAMSAELDKLRPQIADLSGKNSELYRAKSEADNLLRAAEQAIRKLQEQLAAGPAGPAATGSGSGAPLGSEGQITMMSANANATQINGKITSVENAAGRTLIEVPLGTRDGLQVDNRIYVYRANGYVGDAVVVSVTSGQSIAKVVSTKPGETVHTGDLVSTIGK